MNTKRTIPSVESVMQALGALPVPRPAAVAVVRKILKTLRENDTTAELPDILARIQKALQDFAGSRLQPVINGTGVLIHTNLGRAPFNAGVVETLTNIAAHYSNLEIDLVSGKRGQRAGYLEHNLALLCESEAAAVVNNCAAALILILRHFTKKRPEVIISRGELVQIGGGFRIPDILEASGARLREIGTTNHTDAADYAQAINQATGLILKVHRSNFFMGGFVSSPATEEIAAVAKKHRLPLVEDLGSGAVVPIESWGFLEHEPTPGEILKRGVDLVCFSGDKLFGGPQAGIIAGRARWVSGLKRDPFFRALRCDKLILGGLQAVTDEYLNMAKLKRRPGAKLAPGKQPSLILEMLAQPLSELQNRAEVICEALTALPVRAWVGEGHARLGGGTLPRSQVPSKTVDLIPKNGGLEAFDTRLRQSHPPIIGYLSEGRLRLDLRTIFPAQDTQLIQAIIALFQKHPKTTP